MRIIAGQAKNIRLQGPKKSWRVRPLTDQARGALFNILGARVAEARFLDVFAGTGAVGIEALSRGARLAIFIEFFRPAVELIRQNLALTGFADRAEIYAVEAVRALGLLEKKSARFDLIYLGAPYDSPVLDQALTRLAGRELLEPAGLVIAERRWRQKLAAEYGRLTLVREARYGETVLAFYGVKK